MRICADISAAENFHRQPCFTAPAEDGGINLKISVKKRFINAAEIKMRNMRLALEIKICLRNSVIP